MHTIALIFGGRSSEHGISCVTAGGILRQIDRSRFSVVPIGVTSEGRFVEVTGDPEHWQIKNGAAPHVPDSGDEIILQQSRLGQGKVELRVVREGGRIEHLADIDAVFPLLHGPYGEDGTIQGLFELWDVPYVGSGVLASAVSMDKEFTKRILEGAGLNVARGIVAHESEPRENLHARIAGLTFPLFVKPARAGSSFGVTKVEAFEQLDSALEEAFRFDPKVLIEQGVEGREVECGVLQGVRGEEPRTSLPGEVVIGSDLEFYDYESKYFGKGTVTIDIPASIPEAHISSVREVAAQAFKALQLEGLARVDVFVTEAGEVIVNEVNTMPGFTQISMFPVLWENMGLSYTDLIGCLIDNALERSVGLR
ncbi:D-alanine--D-alanine ligase [Dermabacter sp. p3-SID358]|uniref:D-alanine--D-alanine ligase family protein n=1 Tax=Dermabacter sp. p3-SID358 TaxID=2916114 RepID=UPI0021A2D86B|nr:D-alanine--D-alanine ligase family protein [Dermabacter sp. p3-SID358]MCT1866539.1 D-alanine--D-alanine ligase [Dermabacter sp. p3-SID358]